MTDDDQKFIVINDRLRRARAAGWKFEDTRLTPGVPVVGAIRPDGTVGGVIGTMHRADYDRITRRLDAIGVPA